MAASMLIDQAGLPGGTPSLARTDGLDDGALVTLTSVTVGTTYRFEFLWVPPGDSTAVGSLAATGSPEIWTFSPTAGVWGTYRIKLIVDEGLGTESTTIRSFGIRFPSGILAPSFNEKADEDASLVLNTAVEIEASENNEVSAITGFQWGGWWDFLHSLAVNQDQLMRTRRIKQGFDQAQAGTVAQVVAAWYFKAGTLKGLISRLYMGTDTGIHQATARLRQVGNPVPILATWQVTDVVIDVLELGGIDITLPADDWYTLEIFSGDAAALALLEGADVTVVQDAP